MNKIEQNKFDSLKDNLNFDNISDRLDQFQDNSNSHNLVFLDVDKENLKNQLLQILSDLGININDLDINQLEDLLELLNYNVDKDNIKLDVKNNILDNKITNNLKFDIHYILNNQLYLNLCNNINYNNNNDNNDIINNELKDKFDLVNSMVKYDQKQLINLINHDFNIKENNLTDALTNAILSSQDKNFEQTEFLLLVSVAVAIKNTATISNIIMINPELNTLFKENLNKRQNEDKIKLNKLNKFIEKNRNYNESLQK
jgi:hypothetical protein